MEAETNEEIQVNVKNGEKKKRKWGSRIYNFLASGGLILVIVGGFVIAVIIISKLS